jgi:hypothetical protein
MFQAVKQFIRVQGWKSQINLSDNIIKLQMGGDNGSFSLIIHVIEDREQLVICAIIPTNTPASKRLAMAELITRINDSILIGHFDLDFEDGQVRFRVNSNYDSAMSVSMDVLERNIMTAIITMDKYLPAIMCLHYTSLSPKHALANVEGERVANLN